MHYCVVIKVILLKLLLVLEHQVVNNKVMLKNYFDMSNINVNIIYFDSKSRTIKSDFMSKFIYAKYLLIII